MGNLVDICPMEWNLRTFRPGQLTWQGHSEWSSLKAETHADSQLVSSLQFRTHCPRVLLVLSKQASKLSSLESSLKTSRLLLFNNLNLPCRNKSGYGMLDSHQCNQYDMDRLKIDFSKIKTLNRVPTITTDSSGSITFQNTVISATMPHTLQPFIITLRYAYQTQVIITETWLKCLEIYSSKFLNVLTGNLDLQNPTEIIPQSSDMTKVSVSASFSMMNSVEIENRRR